MNSQQLANWLQVASGVGIIGGLVLVGFQLQQNSAILQTQVIIEESQAMIAQELQMIGENGAAAWSKAMTNPTELTPEEHRIMEAIYWTQKEIWSTSDRLEMLGLVEIEGGRRAAGEAGFFFGNTYGRAWWNTRRDGFPPTLRETIDSSLALAPNSTLEMQERLDQELERLLREK
jgi:hypothetical protein